MLITINSHTMLSVLGLIIVLCDSSFEMMGLIVVLLDLWGCQSMGSSNRHSGVNCVSMGSFIIMGWVYHCYVGFLFKMMGLIVVLWDLWVLSVWDPSLELVELIVFLWDPSL
jgi:hypothetical protein